MICFLQDMSKKLSKHIRKHVQHTMLRKYAPLSFVRPLFGTVKADVDEPRRKLFYGALLCFCNSLLQLR